MAGERSEGTTSQALEALRQEVHYMAETQRSEKVSQTRTAAEQFAQMPVAVFAALMTKDWLGLPGLLAGATQEVQVAAYMAYASTIQGALTFIMSGLRNVLHETYWGRVFLGAKKAPHGKDSAGG